MLGVRVNANGILPSTKHASAISSYPKPTTRKAVKQFLGLGGFVSRHIPQASVILSPLYALTSSKQPFIWTKIHDDAFSEFKIMTTTAPGLSHRNEKLPLFVVSDASGVKISGILYQKTEVGIMQPLSYYSRMLTQAERRTGSRTRELYALSDSIKHFEFFLIGITFTVMMDHFSLKWLMTSYKSNNLTPRLLNILAYLNRFNFSIIFMKNTSDPIIATDVLTKSFSLEDLTNEPEPTPIPQLLNCLYIAPIVSRENGDIKACYALRENVKINDSDKLNNADFDLETDIAFRFDNMEFTKSEMLDYQNEDTFCQKIKVNLNTPKKSPFSRKTRKNFTIRDNLIYSKKMGRFVMVLPVKIAFDFLSFYHVLQGHPGSKGLENLIKGVIHINGFQAICQKVTSMCETCLRNKVRKPIRPHKVINRSFSEYPFQRCYIDLVALKMDSHKKNFLLTLTDEMSMYIDGEPISSKRDAIVAEALTKIILRNGAFGTFIHDRGSEFIGPILRGIAKSLNIHTIRTSAYNSRANLTERNHREYWVKHRLLGVDFKHWSTKWPLIRFHLNALPRARNDNLSPHEVVFGRLMYLPYVSDDFTIPNSHNEWTKHMASYFSNLYPQLLTFQRQRYAKTLEKDKGPRPKIEIGSQVLFYKPTIFNRKHVPAWSGPCVIHKQLALNTFEVRDRFGKSFIRHSRNLRLCNYKINEPNPDSDLIPAQNEIQSEEINTENEFNISGIFTDFSN